MEGLHPDLVSVAGLAITISEVDFGVFDGMRTDQEQKQLFDKGASTLDGITRRSMHQVQEDGFAHAMDLVPWIAGRYRWEWPPLYLVAEAVREAAELRNIRIRWGGHWAELTNTETDPEDLVEAYVAKRRAQGKSAFIDGPHFELIV